MIRVVYYDITDSPARTRVSDYLEAEGFERVQFSVFIGKASTKHWERMWKKLETLYMKHCAPTDKIFTHVIERDHFRKMSILGPELDVEWILQEVEYLFI